jgi:hypothetical protein
MHVYAKRGDDFQLAITKEAVSASLGAQKKISLIELLTELLHIDSYDDFD